MHYQEGVAREQAILFPETLGDYITDDNPVQFIDAFVDSLDLGLLGFKRVTGHLKSASWGRVKCRH
jgi:hypothetical protein